MNKNKKTYTTPKIIKRWIRVNEFFRRRGGDMEWEYLVAAPCFTAHTRVLRDEQVATPINQLQVGDNVLSYDTDHEVFSRSRVVEIFGAESNNHLVINGRIEVTKQHAFWVNNASWLPASTLKPGDRLLNNLGEEEEIIEIEQKNDPVTVYNLKLDGVNTFFADCVLVHNPMSKGSGGAA